MKGERIAFTKTKGTKNIEFFSQKNKQFVSQECILQGTIMVEKNISVGRGNLWMPWKPKVKSLDFFVCFTSWGHRLWVVMIFLLLGVELCK